MKMNTPLLHMVWLLIASALILAGCEGQGRGSSARGAILSGSAEEPQPTGANLDELSATLSLKRAAVGGDQALALHYLKREGQVGPRSAELFVSYPASLSYLGERAGGALTTASKELIVQSNREGLLRLIVMSTANLNTLESGVIATLNWRGPSEALDEVRIQARATYFAPSEANIGVTLSPSDAALDSERLNSTGTHSDGGE